MGKRGFFIARQEYEKKALQRCMEYRATLSYPGCEVIRYNSGARGMGYGVVVTTGPSKVVLWDSFTGSLITFGRTVFDSLVVERMTDAG
jgi:hypothetical protein